jgi:hypothetical protein
VILAVLYSAVLFTSTAVQHYWMGSQVWGLRNITPLQDHISRLLPHLQEAQDFQEAKQIIQANDSVLTIANYAAHMAGRQRVKQIDWIVLPAPNIPINIAGKLKRVDRSKLGPQVARVRREAEAAQMPCRPVNASIVICSRS